MTLISSRTDTHSQVSLFFDCGTYLLEVTTSGLPWANKGKPFSYKFQFSNLSEALNAFSSNSLSN